MFSFYFSHAALLYFRYRLPASPCLLARFQKTEIIKYCFMQRHSEYWCFILTDPIINHIFKKLLGKIQSHSVWIDELFGRNIFTITLYWTFNGQYVYTELSVSGCVRLFWKTISTKKNQLNLTDRPYKWSATWGSHIYMRRVIQGCRKLYPRKVEKNCSLWFGMFVSSGLYNKCWKF